MKVLKSFPFLYKPINEDWLAVIIAFVLVLLAALGILGPHGIKIVF